MLLSPDTWKYGLLDEDDMFNVGGVLVHMDIVRSRDTQHNTRHLSRGCKL